MPKKQKQKKQKSGSNKGKKYEKPLSLYGMKFEDVVNCALKAKGTENC